MAVKQLRKKGMFLTFISIAIIAAAIVIFVPSDIELRKDMPVIKTRVSNVNEYVLDLQNVYLERTLQATGRRTIIALIDHVETNGFFPDAAGFENAFRQVLLEGTIGDPPQTVGAMTGYIYNDWLDKINDTAYGTFNVDTYFGVEVDSVRIYQTMPWFVNIDAKVSFNVSSETASWNKTATIKAEISVEDFNDPYYLANSGGSYVNKIRKSGTKFDEWTVEKVKDSIRDGNYTHFENSQAPSFLMRFYNDISASSCCGIESLVNPNNPAIPDKDVSYTDYKYWVTASDCENLNLYKEQSPGGINDEFSDIKFDFSHVVLYRLLEDPSADVQQICPP